MDSENNQIQKVNECIQDWRQGDCFFEMNEFYTVANPGNHISTDQMLEEDDFVISDVVEGLCIVTQTCDIVRDCSKRPYVEVSPLVKVGEPLVKDVEKLKRPNYAFIPNLAGKFLILDLDRTMTIEKSCLLDAKRIKGLNSDEEIRRFSFSLARKRFRFAFPDDFVFAINDLLKHWTKRHGKQNEEGSLLGKVNEIRASAYPSWDSEQVEVVFKFLMKEEDFQKLEEKDDKHLKEWISLIAESDRFSFSGEFSTLSVLSAIEYVESDALDLDSLTISQELKALR